MTTHTMPAADDTIQITTDEQREYAMFKLNDYRKLQRWPYRAMMIKVIKLLLASRRPVSAVEAWASCAGQVTSAEERTDFMRHWGVCKRYIQPIMVTA